MKFAGKIICSLGSAAAVLFPPYLFLGTRQWGFIFNNIISIFGRGIRVYEKIDIAMLVLELLLINGIGVALILFGKRK